MNGSRKSIQAFKAIVLLFPFSFLLGFLPACWKAKRKPDVGKIQAPVVSHQISRQADQRRLASVLASVPSSFEQNRGQSDPSVRFLSRGPGYALFLTPDEAVLSLVVAANSSRQASSEDADPSFRALRLRILNANRSAQIEGLDALPHRSNYLLGNAPSGRHPGVPNFARVRYRSVYPGIDLVFHGDSSRLEFDLNVSPGADVRRARFRLDGADNVRLDASGDLVARMNSSELRLHRPVSYQNSTSGDRPVSGQFILSANNEIGFQMGDYDASLPLVIDPVLSYSTFLGGSGADQEFGVAVDPQGNFYVAGQTASTNLPLVGALQGTSGGFTDAFVAKFNADGSGLAYCTYLGGNLIDIAQAIAVDSNGSAYVAGFTSSTNFPTKNPLQASMKGQQDLFVAKLSPDGASLVFSTYLGGSGLDTTAAIALDGQNNVVVAGTTKSTDFPIVNALESSLHGTAGNSDAFVAKISADGSHLIFSTYLGGTSVDGATGLAIDSQGNILVSGGTDSTDFLTLNALQPTAAGGPTSNAITSDAFLTKLKGDGSAILFSTYWGGTGSEQATNVSVDASDNIFLVGETTSTDFPTLNPVEGTSPNNGAAITGFVTKFASDGSSTLFSTYFGGTGSDTIFGSAVDANGNIYISGNTTSTDLPVTGAIQSAYGGGASDGFVSELSGNGSTLLFSTYLGGAGTDSFNRVAVDSSGAYVVGSSGSSDFPTHGTPANAFGGATDGVIVKLSGINPGPDLTLSKSHTGNVIAGADASYTLAVSNVGNGATTSAISVTDTLPAGLTYSSASGTNWNCAAASQTVTCTNAGPISAGGTSTFTLDVHVAANAPAQITNTASVSVTGDTNSSNNSAADVASITTPPTMTIAFGNSTIGINTSTSLTVTLNNPGGADLTGVAFSDTLPAGLAIATPSGLSSTCGGTATGAAASSSVTLSGATLAAGASCTVAVNVTATTAGVFNDSSSARSSNGGNGSTASASLTVVAPFRLASTFNPSSILVTGVSTLSFTITNPNTSTSLSSNTLTEALPTGLLFVANVLTTSTSTCSAGIVTAAADRTSITAGGFTLAAGASCVFTVQVSGNTAGTFTNSASLSSPLAGPSNSATATLTVNKAAPFVLASSFSPTSILETGVSTLSFTITNPNASIPLSSNTFSETLPTGLLFVASVLGTSTSTCSAGIVTAAADHTSITAGGFTLAAGASCVFTVQVTGTTAGTFTNSASLDSALAGTSNTTTATVTVNKPAPFRLASTFNPSSIAVGGVSTLSFTFTNPNASIPLSALGFVETLPTGLLFGPDVSSTSTSTCSSGISTRSVDGTSVTTGGITLSAGASCIFTVQVNGPTVGTFTNSASLDSTLAGTSNASTATLTVTSNAPIASLSAGSLTFAAQLVGSSSASQSVTLKNTGSVPLAITNSSASGDFSQTNNCGTSVAANASCTLNVTFTPTTSGSRTGTLTITDNASGSPQTVGLTGAGADFTFLPTQGSTTSATISRGQTASYTLNLAPTGGVSGNLSFACSGAPAESSCVVSPTSAPTNGTAATPISVSVSTTAASAAASAMRMDLPGNLSWPTPAALVQLLLCLSVVMVAAATTFAKKKGFLWISARIGPRLTVWLESAFGRGALAAALFALLTFTFLSAGCAGGTPAVKADPGTPAGSYSLTVTATLTSGTSTLKHNVTLTLNVQ